MCPARFRRSFVLLVLGVLSWLFPVSAADLPVNTADVNIQITNGVSNDWTSCGWVEADDENIYLFYSGDLYNVDGSPKIYNLNLTFTAGGSYEFSKVNGNDLDPHEEIHEANGVVVESNTRISVSYTLERELEDEDARTFIDQAVGAQFEDYAWAMARHESRQGDRVYNQFNSGGDLQGVPNRGAPDGWGVAQIDRRSNRVILNTDPEQYFPPNHPGLGAHQYTATEEVWNWHENINAMQAKLVEKRTTYITFINRFRNAYGEQANWSEPPEEHTIGGVTLSAEAWGVMVLYNGVRGVPAVKVRDRVFHSPWVFNPNTGEWRFRDNFQNYASQRVVVEFNLNITE